MGEVADQRRLFWAVIAGIVLYVVLDAIAQSLPPHYNPIRDAESDLAVGPYGYIMTVNFLNRGVLSLLFIYALAKTVRATGGLGAADSARRYPKGTFFFGIWAVGALILAIFPTDVPATPISGHGAIHLVVAILAFLGGAFGALRLSMQFGENKTLRGIKPAALSIAALSVVLVVVDLGLPFVAPHLTTRIGGLTERLFLGSVLLWVGVVAGYLATRKATPLPASEGVQQSQPTPSS
jgi:hypothetical membrane protein